MGALPVRTLWVTLCLSLALVGCGGEKLGKLKRAEPVGTPFQKATAKEYLAFANAEDSKYEPFDAQYFADKGLRAAYGQETAPEKLSKWDVNEDAKPALIQARNDLVDILRTEIPNRFPEKSARAQVLFDCWMMQEEQDIDPYEAFCREDFLALLDQLTSHHAELEAGKNYHRINHSPACDADADEDCTTEETTSLGASGHSGSASGSAGSAGGGTSGGQESTSSAGSSQPSAPSNIVYFDFDRANLTSLAEQSLQKFIPSITKLPRYEIMVNGHTDRAGTESYNLKLSKRRAETVKNRLVQGGVQAEHITIFAFGESSPQEETSDGIRNPVNRRVEISIKTR